MNEKIIIYQEVKEFTFLKEVRFPETVINGLVAYVDRKVREGQEKVKKEINQ